MFGNKTTSTPQVEQAVAKAVNFELTVADMANRSQRRAWLVAWCAVLMALILGAGYFVFLPLKEKVPYLVMADPYTGTATVARLQDNVDDNSVTRQEAINKSNVAQFVLGRESYDSGLIGQRNWRTVLSMAGPQVAPAYMAVHSENNPERPHTLYGISRAVHVRILSITLIGGGSQPYTGATVRFQRSLYDKGRGRSDPIDSKIATLEFTYNPDLKLSEEDRLLNPLGFRVVNYRAESDYAIPPPPEPEFPAPSTLRQPPTQTAPAVPGPGSEAGVGLAPEGVMQAPPHDGALPVNPAVNPDAAAPAPVAPAAANPANGVNAQ